MFSGSKSYLMYTTAAGIVAAQLSIGAPAHAQETADAAAEEPRKLSTVTVTAQKREQSLLDVPVAVSVLNEEALDLLDVKSMEDVSRVSPAITIETADQPGNNVIRMRGIGTAAFSIAAESSVAVVVDEVPLMVTAQAFGNLEDIKRIEILKGPQGTLFGKNASAGVINIVTQDPTDDFQVKIGARATTDEEFKGNISVSGPLSDTLGFRLNAYAIDRKGYMTNLVDGRDIGGQEAYGVRGKVAWRPAGAFDATAIVDVARSEASTASPFIALPLGDPGRDMIVASPDNLNLQLDAPIGFETETDLAVIKWNYDFGGLTLTSVSSYQRYRLDSVVDTDNSTNPVGANPFNNPTGAPASTPNATQLGFQESDAFSQEVRLTSDWGGPFEYMIGGWYSKVNHERILDRGPFRFLLDHWQAFATNESKALFGQATWEFADETFIDFGLRFNNEQISVDYTNFIPNRANPPRFDGSLPGAPPVLYTGSDDDSAVTGKIALRHFLNSGTMVYGSVSTGYKGQTYDISSGFTQAKADNPIAAETSVSYEAGIKGGSSDGTFRYDLTAFWTDYEDYQAQGAIVLDDGGVEFNLNNVGELRTRGIEANFNWQATNELRIDFSGALMDAKIESFPLAICYFGQTAAQGCNIVIDANNDGVPEAILQDLGGSKLNNAPDLKFNVGMYYERNFGNQPFNWFFQGNYQWQDDVNYDLFGNPTNKQDAFGLANFSLGVLEPNGRYRVSLFVNNAFDKLYYTRVDDTSNRRTDGLSQITAQRTRESQRYGGIKVDYTF